MIRVIHLSDLHFGTEIPPLVEALVDDVNTLKPDLIIISGDITQRARRNQFLDARKVFSRFEQKNQLIVPGNHDISLYNLFERFLYPFRKYKKLISKVPVFYEIDTKLAVLGINSVTPYKPMGGFITEAQLELVTDYFSKQPEGIVKVIVMHHNLIRSERHKIINDSEKIINVFAKANVNLILSGHIHLARIEQLKRSFFHHNMYVITAGTAVSNRTIEANSYNIIDIHPEHFELSVRSYERQQFISRECKIYSI